VHDFDGKTAFKNYVIAINEAQNKTRYTREEKEYFALLAEYYQQTAERYEKLGTICAVESVLAPFLHPVCDGIHIEALSLALLGLREAYKAQDPVDSNYTVIPSPTPPSLTLPAPDPSWTSVQLAAYNSLKVVILTQENIIGLSQAEITAINRAEGAYEAGSSYWEQQQISALKRYANLESFYFQVLLAQDAQLNTAYSRSGFPDFSASVDDATQLEVDTAANGLPYDLQQELTTLGVDSDGRALITKGWSSFDPNIIGGDILQTFVPPSAVATTVKQLAGSFIAPFSILSPKVEITSGTSSFELMAPFALGSNSGGIKPTIEDVSLSLNSFAITIPAGSFILNKQGSYKFTGTINGVGLQAIVKPTSTGYQLQIDGSGVKLPSLSNPMAVVVQVGDDGGKSTVTAQIQ